MLHNLYENDTPANEVQTNKLQMFTIYIIFAYFISEI